MAYEKTFHVSWAHIDFNGHMANTAFLDVAVDTRFMYFAEHGFPVAEFTRLRLGPVVRRDEVDYFRELRLLDTVRVNYLLAGISEDGSRFRIRNELFREDGERVARITTLAGWFDHGTRKLVAPPPKLLDAMLGLDRAEDFETLESSLRK